MNSWREDMRLCLEMLKGTTEDRRTVYDWLVDCVVKGGTLNFGYRQVLKQLHAEFFKND